MPKSTENTVFVRFVPTPSQKLPRHQLESVFSEVGPIKKTSWIQSENNASKGYGFVKYLSSEDAETASSSLNGSKISVDGKDYKVLVELATLGQEQFRGKKPSQPEKQDKATPSQSESGETSENANNEFLKKKSRIIIRNLSFYAKENHIRSMVEKQFGKVVDVHLPKVQSNLHVGFCFVTFANPEDAQRAVDAKTLDIQKRTVTMDWSLPKKEHQQQKNSISKPKEDIGATKELKNEEDPNESESKVREDGDVEGEESEEDEDEASDDGEEDSSVASNKSDSALNEGRTVFLRNLPFDATRKDLFDLFAKYGYIESIYLVKDKATQMVKGTAFVTYKRAKSAQMAVAAASEHKEDNTSMQGAGVDHDLVLKGRKILANMAVDKETADTFASKEHNAPAADRRNMYLQAEARYVLHDVWLSSKNGGR
jgi:nucleolar protein 4